jgi:hypothetical protein
MLLQQRSLLCAVIVISQRFVDFEMVTPTGQFNPVITKLAGLSTHFLDAEIGPLTSEESY